MGAINLTTGALEYSTYFGTDGRDEAYMCDIVLTDKGEVVMTGLTQSPDFPIISGAYQTTMKSSLPELWVSIIDPRPIPPPPAPTVTVETDDRKVTLLYELDAEWCILEKIKIYRGETPDKMTFNRTTSNVEKFVDRGLTNGRTYYYRVSAFNSMGEGAWSDVVSAMPLGSPKAPTLEATSGDGTVHLNWTPPTNTGGGEILGYRLFHSLTPREDDFSHLVDLGNVTGWVHEEVELGSEYYYRVLAFNHRIDGKYSSIVLVKATDLPTEPRWLEVTAADGVINVAWGVPNSTGGVTLLGYRLYRGLSPDEMELLTSTLPVIREYVDLAVENGRQYYYQVRAYSTIGVGDPSHTGSILLLGRPSPPLDITVDPGDQQNMVLWDPPENDGGVPITSYIVFAGRTVGGMFIIGTVQASSTEYSHEDLVNGEEWFYKVHAVNRYGAGPFSNIVSATPYGAPDAPTGLVASVVEGGVQLIWLAPSDTGGANLTQYRVYRGRGPITLSLIAYLGIDGTSYIDTAAENGITYHYAVTALTDVGESEYSDTSSATPFGVATAPLNLSAKLAEGAIDLSWQPPMSDGGHPLRGYKVFRGTDPEDLTMIAELSTVLSYTDDDVDLGITYHYSVVVYNQAGDSPPVTISKSYLSTPSEPMDFKVEVTGGGVIITWSTPESDGGLPLTGYLIMRGYNKATISELKTVGLVTSYTDSSVVDGEALWYSVVAVNGLGSGEAPEPQFVKLPSDAPTEGKEEQSVWYLAIIGVLIVLVIVGLSVLMLRRRSPEDEPIVTEEADAAPWHSGVAAPTRPTDVDEAEEEDAPDEGKAETEEEEEED
jgi:fibronectin type 3 domain-containing protein